MKQAHIFQLLALLVLLCSCDKVNNKEILSNAESIVNQYPDSALILLQEIPSIHSLKDMELAKYGFIKGLANKEKEYSLIDDSLLVYSLEYYKLQQDTAKLRSLYKLVSQYYYTQKDYESSDRILGEGIEWAKRINDSTTVSDFYHNRANMLLGQDRNSADAEKYIRTSLEYKESAAAYHTLAGWFAEEDSIFYFNNKSIELALQNKDTADAAFYLRNIADVIASKFKRYNESKEMLRQSMSLPSSYEVQTISMIYVCLDLGELDSAKYYLNKTKETFNLLRTQGYQITTPAENIVAMAQAMLDYKCGKRFDYLPIAQYNDSIYFDTRDKYKALVVKTESKHRLEKENMQLIIHQQQARLWLMAILLSVIVVGGITWLYVWKRKRKLLEAEEKIETLSYLLKEANENTVETNDNRFFKKILLQQLGLIRLVAAVPTSANQELLRQMANITNENIPTDTLLVWDDLFPIVDSVYNDFYTHLTKQYGSVLIEKEIQLCCLLRADFSTKEIQIVTQQSIPTIYQRKTTIRKKLKIGEKEDVISFLEQQFHV